MENTKVIDFNVLNDEKALIDIAQNLPEYGEMQIYRLCAALSDVALVLEQTDEKSQVEIINFLTNEKIIKIFSYMQKDDIVDILGILPINKSKELINLMKEGDKHIIKTLLGYKDDSAGGIMTTEYFTVNENFTLKDALKKIKEVSPKTELLDTLFITNNNKQLIGTVELRDVLIKDENTKIKDITNTNFSYVEPEVDQEEVARMATKYDLTVIPVVNKKMIMLGIITVDDIMDVMVEEQTEDVLKMGGVSEEETLDSSLGTSIKLRLPWLFVNLITAFLAAFTVKIFEGTIAKVVALSSIMSIVTGMGGNAGTQTISIIIRNIAMGKVSLKDGWKLIRKELLLGLINGAAIGIVTGSVVALIYKNFYLGLIIFIAMIANIMISGFCGIFIPLILNKMKIDPALSSSIFLTTATDVLGFFIFLSLANIFLPKLI